MKTSNRTIIAYICIIIAILAPLTYGAFYACDANSISHISFKIICIFTVFMGYVGRCLIRGKLF